MRNGHRGRGRSRGRGNGRGSNGRGSRGYRPRGRSRGRRIRGGREFEEYSRDEAESNDKTERRSATRSRGGLGQKKNHSPHHSRRKETSKRYIDKVVKVTNQTRPVVMRTEAIQDASDPSRLVEKNSVAAAFSESGANEKSNTNEKRKNTVRYPVTIMLAMSQRFPDPTDAQRSALKRLPPQSSTQRTELKRLLGRIEYHETTLRSIIRRRETFIKFGKCTGQPTGWWEKAVTRHAPHDNLAVSFRSDIWRFIKNQEFQERKNQNPRFDLVQFETIGKNAKPGEGGIAAGGTVVASQAESMTNGHPTTAPKVAAEAPPTPSDPHVGSPKPKTKPKGVRPPGIHGLKINAKAREPMMPDTGIPRPSSPAVTAPVGQKKPTVATTAALIPIDMNLSESPAARTLNPIKNPVVPPAVVPSARPANIDTFITQSPPKDPPSLEFSPIATPTTTMKSAKPVVQATLDRKSRQGSGLFRTVVPLPQDLVVGSQVEVEHAGKWHHCLIRDVNDGTKYPAGTYKILWIQDSRKRGKEILSVKVPLRRILLIRDPLKKIVKMPDDEEDEKVEGAALEYVRPRANSFPDRRHSSSNNLPRMPPVGVPQHRPRYPGSPGNSMPMIGINNMKPAAPSQHTPNRMPNSRQAPPPIGVSPAAHRSQRRPSRSGPNSMPFSEGNSRRNSMPMMPGPLGGSGVQNVSNRGWTTGSKLPSSQTWNKPASRVELNTMPKRQSNSMPMGPPSVVHRSPQQTRPSRPVVSNRPVMSSTRGGAIAAPRPEVSRGGLRRDPDQRRLIRSVVPSRTGAPAQSVPHLERRSSDGSNVLGSVSHTITDSVEMKTSTLLRHPPTKHPQIPLSLIPTAKTARIVPVVADPIIKRTSADKEMGGGSNESLKTGECIVKSLDKQNT